MPKKMLETLQFRLMVKVKIERDQPFDIIYTIKQKYSQIVQIEVVHENTNNN